MSPRRKPDTTPDAPLVWERPEPPVRPSPGPLSRDAIVRAAMSLADKEGLEAVSFRKVGAALDAGPMRLYGYMSTKEELLELMVDVVYGEMPLAETKGDWREALRALAHGMRLVATKHRWFPELLGNRPNIGPNALAHLEVTLTALSETPGFENIDDIMLAVATVRAYVLGAIQAEATEQRVEHESGVNKEGWQSATGPYILRMIATGRYPTLGKVVEKATHPPPDARFDIGLEYVLAGIAARHLR